MGDWGAGEERVLFSLDGEVREEGLITCDKKNVDLRATFLLY